MRVLRIGTYGLGYMTENNLAITILIDGMYIATSDVTLLGYVFGRWHGESCAEM